MALNPTSIDPDSPEGRLRIALADYRRLMGEPGAMLAEALQALSSMVQEQARLLECQAPANPDDPKLLLDISEVAERLGIAESSVSRAVARGEIPVVHVGKRRKVRSADLRRYVADLEVSNRRPDIPIFARPRRGAQSRRS